MAITLTTSTPAQLSADYFINKPIELIFDKAIATASLNNTVFSLIDIDSSTSVPLTITAGANDATKVYLLPSLSLKQNTQYRVLIAGSDAGLGTYLTSQDADTLTTTIVIEFSTGDSVYKIDTVIEKQASNLTLEGDLFLPTNVKAVGFDFTIDKIRPKNNKHGVDVTLTGDNTVRFTFTKALYTGNIDTSDWVDVNLYPLLNSTSYLATDTTFGVGTIPAYTVSVTGADLLVTFTSSLPKNLNVQISLLDGIQSLDGDQYDGNLLYSINTQLYPEVYGIQTITREVKEIVNTFTEDYIGALLFKNTIWIWEKVGRGFDLSSVPFAAKQYIVYTTILDLMEDQEYAKFVLAGTRRQLGDLGVSIDNIIGRIAMKVAKYQKLKDIAFESIIKGWQFRVGTSSVSYEGIAQEVNRLWYDISTRYTFNKYSYDQQNIPAANATESRRARTNNPFFW